MHARVIVAVVAALLSVPGCGDGARTDSGDGRPRASVTLPTPSSPRPSPSVSAPLPGGSSAPSPPPPSIRVPEVRRPPRTAGLVRGADISWPQCPEGVGIPGRRGLGLPMPLPSARFVVVGLTNGPGYTTNPCLEDQVQWVRERHLMAAAYAVVSFPDDRSLRRYAGQGPFDRSDRLGRLSNAGYQQALLNVAAMQRADLLTPVVWVDVEWVRGLDWSTDLEENAAVVAGAAQAYADAGYAVGTYSTPALWTAVVGPLALGLPEWRAAGTTSRAEALRRCRPDWSFQGGDGVLGQWVAGSRDHDTTCPGVGRELARWFHQY